MKNKEAYKKLNLLKDFLIENKIELYGCGCCGSPNLKIDGVYFENVNCKEDDESKELKFTADDESLKD